MTDPQRILVVDHDANSRTLLADELSRAGFVVDTATDGGGMWLRIARAQPDLVIFDMTRPGDEGMALCRRLLAHGRIPLIMLGTPAAAIGRITGLEMGADDYVTKPWDGRELLARVRALLRRVRMQSDAAPIDAPMVVFEGWRLDRRCARLTSPQGLSVSLGRTDHRVLCALLDRANREVSREYLVEHIYHKDYLPNDRAIDMSISRLRRHLESDPAQPQLIRTIRHIGYMLAARVTRAAQA
ncbi:response regulator transcription factor [Dyella sp.]|uniref:response regulator transcription factor n=1 Tax=Dyella sp. TaxID=1869338 RepID=UPI002ED5F8EB